jgi:hypothetical protein
MHSGALMQILPHKFEQQQSRLSFTFESSLTPSLNAASSAVDHGFDSWSGKTKDFKMSIF